MKILLSIVTTAYDNPDDVRKTLASIKFWDERFEVIVVDGSCDERIKRIVDGTPATLFQERDGGVYEGMNNGLRLAQGRFVLFLNSGDELHSKATFSELLHSLSMQSPESVCFCHTHFIVPNSEPTLMDGRTRGVMRWIRPIVPPHPSLLVPRSFYSRQYFDTSYRICADYEYKLRLLATGRDLVEIPIVLSRFWHGGLSTTSDLKAIWNKRRERLMIDWTYGPKRFLPVFIFMFLMTLILRK